MWFIVSRWPVNWPWLKLIWSALKNAPKQERGLFLFIEDWQFVRFVMFFFFTSMGLQPRNIFQKNHGRIIFFYGFHKLYSVLHFDLRIFLCLLEYFLTKNLDFIFWFYIFFLLCLIRHLKLSPVLNQDLGICAGFWF